MKRILTPVLLSLFLAFCLCVTGCQVEGEREPDTKTGTTAAIEKPTEMTTQAGNEQTGGQKIPGDAEEFEGRFYKVYEESVSWTEAKLMCESLGGHLATITSQEEQDFIRSLLEKTEPGKKHFWLGASDEKKEGEWKWVTGEAWDYEHWEFAVHPQPSNSKATDPEHGEDYLELQMTRPAEDEDEYMTWNDTTLEGTARGYEEDPEYYSLKYFGYICEWEPDRTQDQSGEEAVAAGRLAAPGLNLSLTQEGCIELKWDAVAGASEYEIYRYNKNNKIWDSLGKTPDTSYTDTDVTQGRTYRYRIRAAGEIDGKKVTSEYAAKKLKVDAVVKALVVDYQTNSSKRMVKYLKKAGFVVDRVESLDEFNVDDYDTLVIPGGHNITPSVYGAERAEETYGTNLELDQLQIAAVKRFVEKKKPVLGVCRGCQLVNVALGGTINQHIPGWHKKYRDVDIDVDSWLYPRLGMTESVYHYHHQCVETLGEGLHATMWDAEDGRIEGYEHDTLPVYGIQWHPDSMGNQGVDIFRYYKTLVQSVK